MKAQLDPLFGENLGVGLGGQVCEHVCVCGVCVRACVHALSLYKGSIYTL